MTNPFADSQVGGVAAQQQPPAAQNVFDQPNQDSTGANFGFSNGGSVAQPDQKIGHNPFSSSTNWDMAAQKQQQNVQPPAQANLMNNGFPPISGQQQQQSVPAAAADPFGFDFGTAPAQSPQQQPGAGQNAAAAGNMNLDDFLSGQPVAGGELPQQANQVDDIMAAFDNKPNLNKEKSAFDDDDEDGDLGSDIDDDLPKIGHGFQHQSSISRGMMGGLDNNMGGSGIGMSMRNSNNKEESKLESVSLSDANSRFFKQPSLPPVGGAADKEGGVGGVERAEVQGEAQAYGNGNGGGQQKIPQDVLEAHEAFKDIDIEVIKDLYVQAGKNKQTLFEILINMGDPEAAQNDPQPVLPGLQQQSESGSEEVDQDEANQAAMIAAMAGFDVGQDNRPMTELERKDMEMAQKMQERELKRARQSQQQQHRDPREVNQRRQQQMMMQQQQMAYQQQQQQQQPNMLFNNQQMQMQPGHRTSAASANPAEFRNVRLESGSDMDEVLRFKNEKKKKKGILNENEEKVSEKKGFFASLFGCCTSTKQSKGERRNSNPNARMPEQRPKQKQKQKSAPNKKEKKEEKMIAESDPGEISL